MNKCSWDNKPTFRGFGSMKLCRCWPKAQRTSSINADKVHGFLEDLRSLDITVDDESFGHIFGDVHRLAVEHGLRAYDAAYLELAIRKGLPLAILDEDLQKAAPAAGVSLFQPA